MKNQEVFFHSYFFSSYTGDRIILDFSLMESQVDLLDLIFHDIGTFLKQTNKKKQQTNQIYLQKDGDVLANIL